MRPFSQREIDLVQTFSDQALIALENVRLFDEVQARNEALTKSLEQQTATNDILSVIISSPTNLQPVFDMIARESRRDLCEAEFCGGLPFRRRTLSTSWPDYGLSTAGQRGHAAFTYHHAARSQQHSCPAQYRAPRSSKLPTSVERSRLRDWRRGESRQRAIRHRGCRCCKNNRAIGAIDVRSLAGTGIVCGTADRTVENFRRPGSHSDRERPSLR